MSIFKAWASRIWAGLDHVVAELEDHDALVDSALHELGRASRKTAEELEEVRADGAALTSRLALERSNIEMWRAAAAKEDRDIEALEMLRRARRARAREELLLEGIEVQARAEGRLSEHETVLAERIEALERRRELMRSRSAQVEAVPIEVAPIEEIFERWDVSLTRAEHLADVDAAFSELEREEERRSLLIELAELRTGDAE